MRRGGAGRMGLSLTGRGMVLECVDGDKGGKKANRWGVERTVQR